MIGGERNFFVGANPIFDNALSPAPVLASFPLQFTFNYSASINGDVGTHQSGVQLTPPAPSVITVELVEGIHAGRTVVFMDPVTKAVVTLTYAAVAAALTQIGVDNRRPNTPWSPAAPGSQLLRVK